LYCFYCRAWLELKTDHLLLQGVEEPEDEVLGFDLNGSLSPEMMMDTSAEGLLVSLAGIEWRCFKTSCMQRLTLHYIHFTVLSLQWD
jgi:hypothetical protein